MSKTIFITGINSGVGKEMALLYKKDGYIIGGGDLSDNVCSELTNECSFYKKLDVTRKEEVTNSIQSFLNKFKHIDILFACAGISMPKKIIPDFELGYKVIDINIKGVLYTVEATLPSMIKRKSGHIVTMGSISGLFGVPGMAIYGASKSALINFMETLRIDLKKYNIKVTTLAPGFIKTPLTDLNTHKMPFLMDAKIACLKMKNAVDTNKGLYVLPWQMRIVSKVLKTLPKPIYNYLQSLNLLKTT